MRSLFGVVLAPSLRGLAGIRKGRESFGTQALFRQLAIEALYAAVPRRPPRPDEDHLDAVCECPLIEMVAGELRSLFDRGDLRPSFGFDDSSYAALVTVSFSVNLGTRAILQLLLRESWSRLRSTLRGAGQRGEELGLRCPRVAWA